MSKKTINLLDFCKIFNIEGFSDNLLEEILKGKNDKYEATLIPGGLIGITDKSDPNYYQSKFIRCVANYYSIDGKKLKTQKQKTIDRQCYATRKILGLSNVLDLQGRDTFNTNCINCHLQCLRKSNDPNDPCHKVIRK